MMALGRIAVTFRSPLPAGERSDRIARCDPGEGPVREYERVEKPLTRSLRCAPASTSPLRGEVKERLQPKFITLQARPSWSSDMHRGADAAGVAEYAQITLDLGRTPGRLFRIVRELYRRP